MECNREEAVRAKEIAERKMQNKDFVGARKIVLKAQQLYPNLDNISQMLTVCEVHCSAEHKVLGTEMDWYGILQVEQTADEATMKKQYRKLALLLHPDKNKFPGAEAAFKLIGEAQRLLSDPGKRSVYDMKHRASLKTGPQKQSQPQPSRPTYVRNQPGVRPNNVHASTTPFTSMNPHQQKEQQSQPGFSNGNGQQTFWTVCPFCSIRYQYYRAVVNRALRCQACQKPFIAYDLVAQGGAPSVANNQPVPQQKQVPNQSSQKKGPESTARNFPSSTQSQGNLGNRQKASNSFPKAEGTSDVGGVSKTEKKEDGNMRRVDRKEDNNVLKSDIEKPRDQKPSRNRKRGRGNSVVNSSDSGESASSNETEEDNSAHPTGQSGHSIRRSSRQKQQVKYSEVASDDDDIAKSSKRAKGSGSPEATMEQNEAVFKGEGSKTVDPSGCSTSIGESKEVEGQTETVSHGENLPNGSGKAEECKNNGEAAAPVDNQESKIDSASEPKSVSSMNPTEIMEVPESEFFDFDSAKKEECFKVDQMWAIYDNLDGMPRFYARIRKVFRPAFKLRITWLLADPDTEDEVAWAEEELPFACGKFKHEKTDTTEDLGMFSHRVDWQKGTKVGSYKIYPRKGETWALFKNWDIKWSTDADNHEKYVYEYEFVEVLSDYSEQSGIRVTYLAKLKGFVSLFKPTVKNGISHFQIPPNERLRFSHMVPSFRTTGKERSGVPAGCYELDPASLPNNCEKVCDIEEMNVNAETVDPKTNGSSKSPAKDKLHTAGDSKKRDQRSTPSKAKSVNLSPQESNRSYKKPSEVTLSHSAGVTSNCSDQVEAKSHDGHTSSKEKVSTLQTNAKEMDSDDGKHYSASNISGDHGPSSPCYVDPCEIPGSEFHNFQDGKSLEKFQPGQIWALYCDLDGLPKFYAQLYKFESRPDVKFHIRWLECSRSPKGTIQWLDKNMPITCGTFRANGELVVIQDIGAFSHEAKAEPSRRKNCIDIYPRKGEVWALYKNFDSEWTCSDLQNCQYEIVEVLESDDSGIKVMVLEQVTDFETVFSSKKKPGPANVMTIGQVELIRFSHQVPAFQLTDERNGSLRGCWELDPQSMPVSFFS